MVDFNAGGNPFKLQTPRSTGAVGGASQVGRLQGPQLDKTQFAGLGVGQNNLTNPFVSQGSALPSIGRNVAGGDRPPQNIAGGVFGQGLMA